MKKLAVVANTKGFAVTMSGMLKVFFDEYALMSCYEISELEDKEEIEEDIVVLSAYTIFQEVRKKIKHSGKIIVINVTLNKDTIGLLNKLPKDCEALLVNVDYKNCMETITLLNSVGIKDIDFIPYYPGCDYDENIKIAVTMGERDLVPSNASTVIDLGQRLVDVDTINKIAKALDVRNPFKSDEARAVLNRMVMLDQDMELLLGENGNLSPQVSTILKLFKQGMMITDSTGKIYFVNGAAEKIFGESGDSLIGFNIFDVIPELDLSLKEAEKEGPITSLTTIKNRDCIVDLSVVVENNVLRGYAVALDYFHDAEARQHKLRSKIGGSGHRADYNFESILGNSHEINEAKNIAFRLSRSDSNVCIFGESGVGKELFAQSIHNSSKRKDFLFVAVNCSALPDNLLESELYGYEEGAFSGAKKGGKIGLFELAHKGTLFLDEIGEMPLQMQAKLLRVIEEQKLLRIGGKDLIDIDVRVICATNRNLKKMVKEGEFRRDLYYRLCVLPVHVPPLRERGDDLFLLAEVFKGSMKTEFTFTPQVKEKMRKYSWPGNVRELKNIMEYLSTLEKDEIELKDIQLLLDEEEDADFQRKAVTNTSSEPLVMSENDLFHFILEEIGLHQRENTHIGRKALTQKAMEAGFCVTEQEMRTALQKLGSAGYIISSKGRKGSSLTSQGWERLRKDQRES